LNSTPSLPILHQQILCRMNIEKDVIAMYKPCKKVQGANK
jgi:hypothetical protein